MSKDLLRDVFKFTLGVLFMSTLIIPIHFSQAQDSQGMDRIQESINTTPVGSEDRNNICSKLKKDMPFWKTMKILGIENSDYKYYAQYYNIVDSEDKYNGKADQNYKLQLALFNNCKTIPSIDSIKEVGNEYVENNQDRDICSKSPLYIEHGIYEQDCKFSNKCEVGYKFIEEKSTCEKEVKIIEKENEIKEEHDEMREKENDKENDKEKTVYSEEDVFSYKRAKEQGITTVNTIDELRLYDSVTRAELAKMISVFSSNSLGKEYLVEETGVFLDVDSSLGDLEEYVQQAYKYQLMGTGSDNGEDYFYPNAYVTRAEFATVLSRMLFGNKFNQERENWYAQHLYILKKSKLLDNKSPEDLETRSYVIQTLYKLQGLGIIQNIIPKDNPLIDKIEKIGTSDNKNKEIEELRGVNGTGINGTGIQLNYNGVLLHVGFSTDDYKQTLVQYAYKLGGMDFVYMIECENGNWDINAIGDSGHAFGLCQMNDRYHKNFPEDYKTNGIVQVEYCYEKWKGGTKFYGPSRWVKGQRCYNYVKNRFSLVG